MVRLPQHSVEPQHIEGCAKKSGHELLRQAGTDSFRSLSKLVR
jgi:hypothetical protein